MTRQRRGLDALRWLLPLTSLVAACGLYWSWPDFRDLVREAYGVIASGDTERIRGWVRGYGSWGVVVLLGAMLLQAVVAVLPSIATMVAAVLAYGPFWGGALAWGGMLLTGSLMYGVGRGLGPLTVQRFIGEKTGRSVERFIDRYGSWAVIIARLTPLSSSDAVSFIAGALKMGYCRFMLAMALGTLPLVVLIAWLGEDMGRLKLGLGVTAAVSVAAFAGHVAWSRWRRRSAEAGDARALPVERSSAS